MSKPWAFATDCRDLHDELERHQCTGRHEHAECHCHWSTLSEGYIVKMSIVVHNAWLNFVTLQRRREVPAAAATSDGDSTCSGSETSSQASSSGDE